MMRRDLEAHQSRRTAGQNVARLRQVVQRRLGLLDQQTKRGVPSWKVFRQCQPRPITVDLVVLVNDEIAIRDGECPVHPVGSQDTETRQSIGRLAEFDLERITGLLEQIVIEVRVLATLDDLDDPGEPAVDVEQLFGCLTVYQSSTASRRMSSSSLGLSPP